MAAKKKLDGGELAKTLEEQPVKLSAATPEELKKEIMNLKFQINKLQTLYFAAKGEVADKERMILELFVKYDVI